MKPIFLLFIVFSLMSYTNIDNKEIIVTHDIDAITVYLNNAEIIRKAKITIPKGKTDLIFSGISSRILKEALRISLTNNVKVYATNIEKNERVIKDNKDWILLEEKLNQLSITVKNELLEISILKKELLYLEANMKIANSVSFSQIDEGQVYFKNKIKSIYLEIFNHEERIAGYNNEIQELKNEQQVLKTKINKTNRNIRITVIADLETICDINIKYLVSNAIWKPAYTVRTKGVDEVVTLEYQANIYNDTGNDWVNKPITLAIIDPMDDVSKPILNAWVLSEGYGYESEGRLSKAKGYYDGDGEADEYVIESDDLNTRFEIKDLHLIPSDATPHLIDVNTFVRKADYSTLSIPKVKDGAFVIASLPNWESMNLLNGPMNLYFNDEFQGVSYLNTQQINKKLDISLGKDNSYRVTRRKVKSLSKEKLIGFNIVDELTYEILVKNNSNKVMKIEVKDQLPISVDKNVEVKAIDISNAVEDKLSGVLTWDLQLQPNETKRIVIKFSVKYPKKKRGILRYDKKSLRSPRFF